MARSARGGEGARGSRSDGSARFEPRKGSRGSAPTPDREGDDACPAVSSPRPLAPSQTPAVTPRALLIGLLIAAFVNVGSPYAESVGFSNFSWSYVPEGAVIPFLVVLAGNALWRRIGRGLSAGELLVVFMMALAANCTAIFLLYFWLAAIVSPRYFATAENHWNDRLLTHLRPPLIVQDEEAVRRFYLGLAPGERIPWQAWATPLLHWLPFFAAFLLAGTLMVAFFHHRWREEERLAYPLMQLPLTLVGMAEGRAHGGRLFLLGAAGPFLLGLAHVSHLVRPAFPALPIDHLGSLNWGNWQFSPHFPPLPLSLNFLALGLGYFVPADVLLSVWLFYLLIKIGEQGLIERLGISLGYGGMFVWGNAAIAWQSFGAFAVLVAATLAGGRRVRHSVIPRRVALPLFAAALLFMAGWLAWSGLPETVIAIFLPCVLLISLGLARVVCQSGIFYVVPPVIAQNVPLYTLGSAAIGPKGMAALGMTYSWHGDAQTQLPAMVAQGLHLWPRSGAPGWAWSAAIGVAVLVGLAAVPLTVILSGYRQGAITWSTWLFAGYGPQTYGQVLDQILNPTPALDPARFSWMGAGAAGMAALTALRLRFAGWPLHPVGLAVVSSFTLYAVYGGFFVAWIAKIALLRWGGYRAYRETAPFFIGLAVGHYLARAVALPLYAFGGIQAA
jgi:hypothetical protein